MSQDSQVDRSGVDQAIGYIDQAHADIDGVRGKLQGEIDALRPGWVGNAADAFYNAHGRFNEEFQKVLRSLEDINEKLRESNVSYRATEDNSTQAVNPILGML